MSRAARPKRLRCNHAREKAATTTEVTDELDELLLTTDKPSRAPGCLLAASEFNLENSKCSAILDITSSGSAPSLSFSHSHAKSNSPLAGMRQQSEEDEANQFGTLIGHLGLREGHYSNYMPDMPIARFGLEMMRKCFVTQILQAHTHCEMSLATLYLIILTLDTSLLSKRMEVQPYLCDRIHQGRMNNSATPGG